MVVPVEGLCELAHGLHISPPPAPPGMEGETSNTRSVTSPCPNPALCQRCPCPAEGGPVLGPLCQAALVLGWCEGAAQQA
jgi:hypothetical protein